MEEVTLHHVEMVIKMETRSVISDQMEGLSDLMENSSFILMKLTKTTQDTNVLLHVVLPKMEKRSHQNVSMYKMVQSLS